MRRGTLVQAKGARRQMQGGALALPEFCFFTFFIIISQFRSVFCMHKVRQSQSLFYRNITAGVGVPQADTIHVDTGLPLNSRLASGFALSRKVLQALMVQALYTLMFCTIKFIN